MSSTPHLSPRERQLAKLLLSGHSLKVLAHDLGITNGTAKGYCARLMRKLGCSTRIEYMAREISSS